MRSSGRLKLGYYPLPTEEGRRLRRLIQSDQPFSALDPCAGTGEALNLLTKGLDCKRYGVELDADRASAAAASGIDIVQGNIFDTHAKVETFSLLYLNPPYDSEIGSLSNQRMEYLFLEHTYRWLVVGGLLVFVVPEQRIGACESLLASHFSEFRIFRLSHPESIRFNQVVLTAVRKPMRGNQSQDNRNRLLRLIYNAPLLDLQEELDDVSDCGPEVRDEYRPYRLSATAPAGVVYRGLPLDEIEDLIPQSPVWKQVAPFLLPKEEMTSGRPITPLHGGHVGLLCTAGLLNGVFGSGRDRHIARWRSIKHVTIIKEQEDDVSIVRKRERFSNELSLVYEDGRTLLLTESPKKEEQQEEEVPDAERTPETRAA